MSFEGRREEGSQVYTRTAAQAQDNWPGRRIMLRTFRTNFDPTKPNIRKIFIEDIAIGLERETRWSGFTIEPYSVATHSVHVSTMLEKIFPAEPMKWLEGLLHDASEAYLGDMPRGLKPKFPDFVAYENALQRLIFQRFGVKETGCYHQVDRWVAHEESRSPALFVNFSADEEGPAWIRTLRDKIQVPAGTFLARYLWIKGLL
jgi:hypothetical protein